MIILIDRACAVFLWISFYLFSVQLQSILLTFSLSQFASIWVNLVSYEGHPYTVRRSHSGTTGILWSEIRVFWPPKISLKSCTTPLVRYHQIFNNLLPPPSIWCHTYMVINWFVSTLKVTVQKRFKENFDSFISFRFLNCF